MRCSLQLQNQLLPSSCISCQMLSTPKQVQYSNNACMAGQEGTGHGGQQPPDMPRGCLPAIWSCWLRPRRQQYQVHHQPTFDVSSDNGGQTAPLGSSGAGKGVGSSGSSDGSSLGNKGGCSKGAGPSTRGKAGSGRCQARSTLSPAAMPCDSSMRPLRRVLLGEAADAAPAAAAGSWPPAQVLLGAAATSAGAAGAAASAPQLQLLLQQVAAGHSFQAACMDSSTSDLSDPGAMHIRWLLAETVTSAAVAEQVNEQQQLSTNQLFAFTLGSPLDSPISPSTCLRDLGVTEAASGHCQDGSRCLVDAAGGAKQAAPCQDGSRCLVGGARQAAHYQEGPTTMTQAAALSCTDLLDTAMTGIPAATDDATAHSTMQLQAAGSTGELPATAAATGHVPGGWAIINTSNPAAAYQCGTEASAITECFERADSDAAAAAGDTGGGGGGEEEEEDTQGEGDLQACVALSYEDVVALACSQDELPAPKPFHSQPNCRSCYSQGNCSDGGDGGADDALIMVLDPEDNKEPVWPRRAGHESYYLGPRQAAAAAAAARAHQRLLRRYVVALRLSRGSAAQRAATRRRLQARLAALVGEDPLLPASPPNQQQQQASSDIITSAPQGWQRPGSSRLRHSSSNVQLQCLLPEGRLRYEQGTVVRRSFSVDDLGTVDGTRRPAGSTGSTPHTLVHAGSQVSSWQLTARVTAAALSRGVVQAGGTRQPAAAVCAQPRTAQ